MTSLGIDLGTTFTCAFTSNADDNLEILELHHGSRITRSVVQIAKGKWSIPRATDLASPQRKHLSLAKRLIGRTSDDRQLAEDVKSVCHIVGDDTPRFSTGVPGEAVLPEEVSAFILGRIRNLAIARMGQDLNNCVVAVPAYFTHRQREATVDAAEIAGFDRQHVTLVPEPLAALVAYVEGDGQNSASKQDGHWMVVDIGGGTSDFTVAYIERTESRHSYVVNATRGHNALGGTDFDEVLMEYVYDQACGDSDDELLVDRQKLLAACERAKEELSQTTSTVVTLEDEFGEELAEVEVNLEDAERAWQDEIAMIRDLIQNVLRQSANKKVANVLVAGGTGNMRCVRAVIRDVLPEAQVHHSNLSEAVGQGAALVGSNSKITMTDVLPRGIGIELENGEMGFILAQNAALPATAVQVFGTPVDNCPLLRIRIFEGDSSKVRKNILLGDFNITDIPLLPAGTPVKVTINIDRLGEVAASARVESQSESLTIQYQPRHNATELRNLRQITAMRLEGKNGVEQPLKRDRAQSSVGPIKRLRRELDEVASDSGC
ncbi:hypothetical protein CaCOL14_000332 [Colletotrichum acutatum]